MPITQRGSWCGCQASPARRFASRPPASERDGLLVSARGRHSFINSVLVVFGTFRDTRPPFAELATGFPPARERDGRRTLSCQPRIDDCGGSARATMNSWEPVYEVVKWFSRTLGLRLPAARKTQQMQQLLDSGLYGPRHLRRADKPSRILCCSIHCRWAQVSVFSLHSIPAQANLPQQSLTKLWNNTLPLYPLVVFHQSPIVDSCIVRLCCIWN